MLDTVKLESPDLGADIMQAFEHLGVHRCAQDRETGENLYHLTTGHLQASHDHRLSYKLTGDRTLILEGSVHKAILGHNIEGGPCDPVAACRWLVHHLE